MKNKTIVIFVLLIFFIGCNKTRKFNVEDINPQDYSVLIDTTIIRDLIYNNHIISGWADIRKRFWIDESSKDSLEQLKFSFFKKNFDILFWERTDRRLSPFESNLEHFWPFVLIDSVTWRLVDTIYLKDNSRGYLILKKSEKCKVREDFWTDFDKTSEQLFLSCFDKEDRLINTYLVAEKYETNKDPRITKKEIYSKFDGERLFIYFNAKNYHYFDSINDRSIHFDSLYIRSVYNLEKHTLVKSDTIVGAKKKKKGG